MQVDVTVVNPDGQQAHASIELTDEILPSGFAQHMGVGGVTDTAFSYRARTTSAAILQIEYWEESDPIGARLSTGIVTAAADDFTGGERITGLLPDRRYFYQYRVNGGVAGPPSSFRTFPPADVQAIVQFGWASCQTSPTGSPSFASIAARDLDLFVHLGDFGYPGVTDLAVQRANLRAQYAGDFHAHIASRMPVVRTWDDADYGGNHADGGELGKAFARQAFLEYTPVYPLPGPGLWQSVRLGCVELFVLDTRYFRTPSRPRFPDSTAWAVADAGSTSNQIVIRTVDKPPVSNKFAGWYIEDRAGNISRALRFDPATRTLFPDLPMPGMAPGMEFYLRNASFLDMNNLGAAGQLQWLLSGIRNSTAIWKVIASSSVWSPSYKGTDSWGGWPVSNQLEQRYLLKRLAEMNVRNVVVVSGDRHVGAIDNGTNSKLPEATASPLNAQSYSIGGVWSQGIYDRGHCFGTVEATPAQLTMTIRDRFGAPVSQVTPLTLTAA
jgi:phosphodiesterase/alkaline phosphatase D-like protein